MSLAPGCDDSTIVFDTIRFGLNPSGATIYFSIYEKDNLKFKHQFIENGDDVCGGCGKFRSDFAFHFLCAKLGHEWDWGDGEGNGVKCETCNIRKEDLDHYEFSNNLPIL